MEKKQNVPALRFQGFSGEWISESFENLSSRVSTMDNSSALPRVEYEDIVSGVGVLNKDIYKKSSSKTGIKFSTGDILYGKLRPYLKNWLFATFSGIAVGDFWVLHPEKVAGNFLYCLIQSNSYQDLVNMTTGTKMPRADWAVISKAKFVVPYDLGEQEQIGKFLTNFDKNIFVCREKIQKLQQFRQAMLTKLFPREGAAEPELRFRGFSGKWRIRTLAKCAALHARIGWQNLRKSEFLTKGDYYLITGTDFVDGQIEWRTCHYVSKLRYDQDKNIQVQNGDILVTKDGTLGKVAYVDGADKPATLNAGVFNVKINVNDVDAKYLYQYLKGPYLMDYVNQRATGGTIKHLNQNILVDFPVVMPSFEEQKIIGDFFYRLDRYISLQQKKLERMQRLKAALLEKLFV